MSSSLQSVVISGVFDGEAHINEHPSAPGHSFQADIGLRIDSLGRSGMNSSYITVRTYDETAKFLAQNITKNTYVMISDANLYTETVTRVSKSVCMNPNCGCVNNREDKGNNTYVVANDIDALVPNAKDRIGGGTNIVTLTGNLVEDPRPHRTEKGILTVKFAVALDRPGWRIVSKQTTDYPYMVAFGNTAEYILSNFKKGDLIAVKGKLQERIIEFNYDYRCECGQEYEWRPAHRVLEVVITEANKIVPSNEYIRTRFNNLTTDISEEMNFYQDEAREEFTKQQSKDIPMVVKSEELEQMSTDTVEETTKSVEVAAKPVNETQMEEPEVAMASDNEKNKIRRWFDFSKQNNK